MNQKVEFIESYIKIGNSDYKWNDNHGELTRCKDCIYADKEYVIQGLVWCVNHGFQKEKTWFCADGKRDGGRRE